MSLFLVSSLLTTVISVFLALFIAVYGKNILHRMGILFNLSVALWGAGCFIAGIARSPEMAVLGWRLALGGGIFISTTFYHTVLVLGDIAKRKLLILAYSVDILFVVVIIIKSSILFCKSFYTIGNVNYPIGSIYYIITMAFWTSIAFVALFELYLILRKSAGAKRTQIYYLFVAVLIGFFGGISVHFPFLQIAVYPVGNIGVTIYSVIATYAILRYQLLDIRIAGARAGIFALVYAFVLGIPFGLAGWGKEWLISCFGQGWFWAPMVLLLALATVGPFIYQIFRKRAENAILREERLYQHKLRAISATMLLIKELDRLLKTITLKVMGMVCISWAAVYLLDEKNKSYKLMFKKVRKGTGNIAFPEEFAFDSPFVSRLSKPCLPIIGEELDGTGIKAGLSVPCFIDLKLHGFMLLGEKLNKAVYTQDDVNVFAVLANQTALAIENCQFHLQEKYLHHAKRLESLDRQMASMAHEIDNPIQCINGNTYDVEICCNEFRSSMSPEKRQEYDSAVKQIKFNTGRISKMIGAVSAYSKADNDEVRIVGLHEILEDVYQITFAQFKANAVTYAQDYPEDHVWLRVNKIEVEQVLVNLATNSIHAVAGKWKIGKNLPGEKKEVKLKAYKMDNGKTLRMDFSDNGYGIKKGIQEDIFLDFVTTKASTEGTGLGLSISRKLVAKYKGKIWAESEGENKGATVHVEIPIPDDITGQEIEAQKKELNENKIRYAF